MVSGVRDLLLVHSPEFELPDDGTLDGCSQAILRVCSQFPHPITADPR
jgi:hypothetical protein